MEMISELNITQKKDLGDKSIPEKSRPGKFDSRRMNGNRRPTNLVEEVKRDRNKGKGVDSGVCIDKDSMEMISELNITQKKDLGEKSIPKKSRHVLAGKKNIPFNKNKEGTVKDLGDNELNKMDLSNSYKGCVKENLNGLMNPSYWASGFRPIEVKGRVMKGVGKIGINFTNEGIRPSKILNDGLIEKVDRPKKRRRKRAIRLGQVRGT
ncbi:hypothetical protein LWI28_018429 [Acer negundo]|uniref:Uncharacterized protein n=1 Tax=Acer negundo TaxID=4023 RepID=A0AAD5NZV5_ACENE|nr:hypothetical protein LWI28_018429 [Acer negundo]KAK4853615.1 hypothetical protein QYF36_011641 [Acer negundo]